MAFSIDIDSVLAKTNAFGESEEGKRASYAARELAAFDIADEASEAMKRCLKRAASELLPASAASVLEHFDRLIRTTPEREPNGKYSIRIEFVDDLSRRSLYEEGYPDGVKNIVWLLNYGYHARDYVYGYWDNHRESYEQGVDLRSTDTDAWIRSMKDREGLHFLEHGIDLFMHEYGTKHKVKVVIEDPIF